MIRESKIYYIYKLLSKKWISNKEIIDLSLNFLKKNKVSNVNDFLPSLNIKLEEFNLNKIDLIELIGLAHQKDKEKVYISNTNERKHYGIYYTNYSIAKLIAKDTLNFYDSKSDFSKLSFLEPCSGVGIFAIAYLETIFKKNPNNIDQVQNIINKMYFADIDSEAINLIKQIIPIYIKSEYNKEVTIPQKNTYVGDTLFSVKDEKVSKNNLKKIFSQDNFDVILTNPPYKLLKYNSNLYDIKSDSLKKETNLIISYIRKNKIYKYNSGTLNLYKLFLEEILLNLTNENSKIGLLIPSTLLSDKQSFNLRNKIINNYRLSPIYIIPEKNDFFSDVCQSFCFFSIDKKTNSKFIYIKDKITNEDHFFKKPIKVNTQLIKKISSLEEVVPTDQIGWKILSKIHKNSKIKELPYIKNLRGELDLSIDNKYITNDETQLPLIKGNCIQEYTHSKNEYFTSSSFVNKLNGKQTYILKDRIACQQISNINSFKRLKFSIIPKNMILGNSCNFITTENNMSIFNDEIDLHTLLGILNSFLMDWRFRLTNSNNHVGNYEIDELPIVVPKPKIRQKINKIVDRLIENPNDITAKAELNYYIFTTYKLDKQEILYILNKYLKDDSARNLTQRINNNDL